jgi:hypothetical protein
MMHMHGARASELTARSVGVALDRLVGVPVDVGKSSAMAMVVNFAGQRLAAPFELWPRGCCLAVQVVEFNRAWVARR